MLGPVLTANAKDYNMTEIGRYVWSGSTLSLREEVSVDSSIKTDALSSFVVKHRIIADSLTPGFPDDVQQCHVVLKYPPAATDASLLGQLTTVKAIIDAKIAAIRRSER